MSVFGDGTRDFASCVCFGGVDYTWCDEAIAGTEQLYGPERALLLEPRVPAQRTGVLRQQEQ